MMRFTSDSKVRMMKLKSFVLGTQTESKERRKALFFHDVINQAPKESKQKLQRAVCDLFYFAIPRCLVGS